MYRSFLESYVYDSHDTIEKPSGIHSPIYCVYTTDALCFSL